MAAEGRWLMGRVIPHQLLERIGRHLTVVAPERFDALVDAIGTRAGELVEEDRDLAVDGPAKGMLAMSAVVLAAYETLRPEFDGETGRTILFLEHVFGEVLQRSIEVVVSALAKGDAPLDLCAWDANWMKALDPAVTGLRAERTSLPSLGDDACRFRVLGTDDPLAAYEDVLDQGFARG